jgi:branched-chain amino acid transport system permease protein
MPDGLVRISTIVAAVVVGGLLPSVTDNPYVISVGIQVEVVMCLALGLNLVVGYAGLLDLGFAAFFAIGAYATGILSTDFGWPTLATIPVGVGASLVGAVLVGVPTLRLRSDYLAVVTLGFGEIIQNVVTNLNQTGGPTGIFGIPPLALGSLQILTPQGYYYVFFISVLAFAFVSARIRHSRLGRAWVAIREDEDAAQAMGIKTWRYKLFAYMAGGVIGSITGGLYASASIAIAPPSFGFPESLLVLMAVAIGGMGSIWGALLGAAVVEALPEALRGLAQSRFLMFGLFLVAMMMLRPQGLWPERGVGFRSLSRPLLHRLSAARRSRNWRRKP